MCCDAEPKPRCPPLADIECEKARLEYLTRQYGYYTTHMNQVFSFYLVAAALVANAFVQSLPGQDHPLPMAVSQAIAFAGALFSVVFWFLHMRGFQIAGLLDDELKEVECRFGIRFMKDRKKSQLKPLTNTILFNSIYLGFIVAFIAAFVFAMSSAP